MVGIKLTIELATTQGGVDGRGRGDKIRQSISVFYNTIRLQQKDED